MAAVVSFGSGLNANSLTQNALAQPSAQQRAHYVAAVVSALGSNPVFEIRIGSTIIYQSTVVGTLTGTATGIEFPLQFTEPPTVNQANALTDPNAVIALRNASNSAVELTVPVRAGPTGNWLSASKALDGTNPVRTAGVILRPPTLLGVPTNEGSPVISLDRLIDDMTEYTVNQPRYGTSSNPEAGIYGANYDNIKGAVDTSLAQGHQFAYKFYDYWDEVLPWFWAYAGQGHNDNLNLRLQYGYGIISIRNKATQQWTDSSLRIGGFDGYKWNGNSQVIQMYSTTGDYFTHDDGTNSSRFLNDDGCELWMSAVKNRSLMVACDAIAVIAKCRIINADGSPWEGESGGCYAVKMGIDMWGRSMPINSYYQDGYRYWGDGCNGSNGRWVDCTTGEWFSVAMVTMDIGRESGNAHLGDYHAPFPWARAPYTPTEASIRANPPSWAIP